MDFTISKRTSSGFTIIGPQGEPWAIAIAQSQGSRGMAHVLRYPDSHSIRRVEDSGMTRGLVTISSHPDRVRAAGGATVPDQKAAILAAFVDAHARGWVKSPTVRFAEKQAAADERAASDLAIKERHDRIERGIRALVARGLTDDETYALATFCKELSYSYLLLKDEG